MKKVMFFFCLAVMIVCIREGLTDEPPVGVCESVYTLPVTYVCYEARRECDIYGGGVRCVWTYTDNQGNIRTLREIDHGTLQEN